MIITHTLHLDMVRPGDPPQVHIVQRDTLSRCLDIRLFADASPWTVPAGTHVLVRYSKPDGHSGEYDSLPDGSAAWSIRENCICITLAPQVCNVSGSVQLALSLLLEQQEVSTFPIILDVQALPEAADSSEDYHYIQYYIPQPAAPASPGQLLQVASVSATGSILSTRTVDASAFSGAEALVVHIRYQGGSYTADQSFASIRSAIAAGRYCHADFGGNILPLAESGAEGITFLADRRTDTNLNSLSFTLMPDESVVYAFQVKQLLSASEVEEMVAQKGGLIVNITQSGNSFFSDKTFAQVEPVIYAGGSCYALFGGMVLPLASANASQIVFSYTGLVDGGINFFRFTLSANDILTQELRSYTFSTGEVLADAEGVAF